MSRSNWWIGGVLIALGFMLLLNNLGVTNINIGEILRTYWPLLLVLWGANILALRSRGGGSLLSGSILLILGLVFLGRNLGFLPFDMASFWRIIWPVIIILAGISLIKGPLSGGKNNIAFLGGVEKTKERWKLESGNYWAFMGGIDLDLRKAEMEEKEYLLSCIAVMGGIDIIVPPNLTVICDGTAILGGVDFMGEGSGGIIGSCSFRYEGKNSRGAVVKIYSRAFMGGIDVKVKE
jgi:predicted membrane protein